MLCVAVHCCISFVWNHIAIARTFSSVHDIYFLASKSIPIICHGLHCGHAIRNVSRTDANRICKQSELFCSGLLKISQWQCFMVSTCWPQCHLEFFCDCYIRSGKMDDRCRDWLWILDANPVANHISHDHCGVKFHRRRKLYGFDAIIFIFCPALCHLIVTIPWWNKLCVIFGTPAHHGLVRVHAWR